MLYRVSGALFFLFGSFHILGYLFGDGSQLIGASGFAGQSGGLVMGIALFVAGLYLLIKRSREQA